MEQKEDKASGRNKSVISIVTSNLNSLNNPIERDCQIW
jgi:hypothetical protein